MLVSNVRPFVCTCVHTYLRTYVHMRTYVRPSVDKKVSLISMIFGMYVEVDE